MDNDNYYVVMTRFLCPTNHRGSRIKASDHLGSVIFHYDHVLSSAENHRAAATMLLKARNRLSGEGKIVGGVIRTRDRVWMQIPADQEQDDWEEEEMSEKTRAGILEMFRD